MKKVKISKKTFDDIVKEKYNFVCHDLSKQWRPLLHDTHVTFIADDGACQCSFKIIRREITILKTIKIYIQKI